MKRLTSLISADPEFLRYKELIGAADGEEILPIAVNGLTGGAELAFITESVILVNATRGGAALVLAESESDAERICRSLLGADLRVARLKRRELVFHNIKASHDTDRERLSVLYSLMTGKLDVIVSTASALIGYTMPKERLRSLSASVAVGEEMAPEALASRLSALGLRAVETVEGAGQLARRGGILDFWSGDAEYPTRVEFFGDEIDRIATFDPISQRTLEMKSEELLLPALEVIEDEESAKRLIPVIDSLIERAPSEDAKGRLMRERAAVEGRIPLDSRDRYINIIYPERETPLDYFKEFGAGVALVVGTAGVRDDAEKYSERIRTDAEGLITAGLLPERGSVYTLTPSAFSEELSRLMTVHINSFAGGISTSRLRGLFGFRCRRTVAYGDNASMLFEDITSLLRADYRVILLSETKEGASALSNNLTREGFSPIPLPDRDDFDIRRERGGSLFVGVGACEGFDLITPKIALLSMARDEGHRIMAERRKRRILKKVGGRAAILDHAELSVGDYVVHASYGIGLFEGISTVTVDGVTKDYITVRYAGTDKLFVPCDKLELIGKYIGERDKDGKVKLSKMGGTEWHKTKARARSAAKDIAKDLIALYAERQRTRGFAFPPDSELEDSFAESFPYELTDSQTNAVREIKEDMMRPVPMNRLLCGDVGFGKTEVALRAAFKAVLGGKQVAILVPTTILALQHYETAVSRMSGYPVNVDMLSRFKKPKEQEAILKRVKRGETDILIGTHKLLSKSLEFSDLGLLIIDEEQRFGVAQKEKLKELSKNVDVLTLSATPIPRTLNMAMSGINDISVLDEAPGERRPVQTYVLEHDETLITDAITKELSRGGQVLYLYNKVEDIDLVADRIMKSLPEARVAAAHGRMDKDELEDIWQALVKGELDVLVSTTIIETGVDLPGANTLIIENADRFGLSQLHQIRGRVGRSERQAYAYFTYRPGKALSEIAEKRLNAIREYAEFGAGFKIALCDLEIRGAGNLLGAEQHGYIESVGYDLYMQILAEAVLEEKGESPKPKTEAHINIKVNAHIPDFYIENSSQRMEMYKKVSHIGSMEDAEDIRDEFVDRFGEPPRAVDRLIEVALSKAVSEKVGIRSVESRGADIVFNVGRPDLAVWSVVFSDFPGMRFSHSGDQVIYRPSGEPISEVAKILSAYEAAYLSDGSDAS